MQTPSAPKRPRRSAFAAAVFSFLLPGLGHAYIGRWGRGLGWLTPWILAVALIAGVAFSMGVKTFLVQFADPSWLVTAMAGIGIDLVYRLACLLDAYRLAGETEASGEGVGRRIASVAGLVAVLAVLVVSHLAVARPLYLAYGLVSDLDAGDLDPLQSLPPDFRSGEITPRPLVTDPPTPEPTLVPGATATPTPLPTPTPAPTPTPEPTPTQGPPWTGKGLLNILLIGADAGRKGYSGYLTDTMLTVSIDPDSRKVAFISLPRDTQGVPLPREWPAYRAYGGFYPNKINTLYTYARSVYPDYFPGNDKVRGYNALKGALGELYGLKIDYYVAVDLNSFRDVIDELGGVVIDVQNPVYDAHYPTDDSRGALKLYIPPGIQYMDGREALAYARARHATSDFDRSARQQRVVTSVRDQIDLSSLLAPGKIEQLFKIFKRSVRTDIPPSLLPKMIQLGQEIDLDERISLVLTPPRYSRTCYLSPPPCPQDNLYSLQANITAIRKAVKNVFKADPAIEKRIQQIESEGVVVSILNGTRQNNLKITRIADYLAQQGVDASVPPVNGGVADRRDYTNTAITVYNGAEISAPATIDFLERRLHATAALVDDPTQASDIVVIVGTSTPELKPEV